jgi:hypothetical protein
MAYLGKYAMNNPDQPAWYGSIGAVDAIFSSEKLAIASKA